MLLSLISCSNKVEKLPYLGNLEINDGDTIFQTVDFFQFINQDSLKISNTTFKNKIYVADFIFLNCPTICPSMTKNMNKVYKHYNKNNSILFLSHTIDPKNDSIYKLKRYANELKVDSKKWHFVTGDLNVIHSIAEQSYYAIAYKDSIAPGGFVHSGGFLLVDKKGRVRGVYDGTSNEGTNKLINDIAILLKE